MDDAAWMRRALRLAAGALGMTWPNPGVGCVLARDGRLLGAGAHRRCGALHAETTALADARARGHDPRGATAYVTLAPCTRHGRQPPCVEALRAAGVARVVAAIADPHQDDAGAALAAAGIAYDVGCGAAVATHLHGGFLSRITRGRPRLTGKWAMTADGCLAAYTRDAQWISSPLALARSRRRRRAFDAIVVGTGTALADDPQLLALPPRQHGDDDGPVRIVLGRAPLPATARLRQGTAPLWCLGTRPGDPDPHDPPAVAAWLGTQGLNEVLVEGGAQVHAAWMAAGLYDRLELYLAPTVLGGGLPVAAGPGAPRIADAARYRHEAPPALLDGTLHLRLTR